MKSSKLFWAIVLILVGVVLLLGNLGVLVGVNIWGVIWPLVLMAFGAWVLYGALAGPKAVEVEEASIPLEGAARARVKISHGAGRLTLAAGAASDQLATGKFGGGLEYRARREGDKLDVKMHIRDHGWNFIFLPNWGRLGGLDWAVGLNKDVPLELKLETGAGRSHLDLAELKVTDLKLETGASETRITLPANAGFTRVKIEAGAASVDINVPGGVAARIRTQSGLSSIRVDSTRFPRSGSYYESPDYASAANKAEIDIETGVGSVNVR